MSFRRSAKLSTSFSIHFHSCSSALRFGNACSAITLANFALDVRLGRLAYIFIKSIRSIFAHCATVGSKMVSTHCHVVSALPTAIYMASGSGSPIGGGPLGRSHGLGGSAVMV